MNDAWLTRVWLGVAWVCWMLVASDAICTSNAADNSVQFIRQQGDFYLRAVRTSLEKLRSGDCTIHDMRWSNLDERFASSDTPPRQSEYEHHYFFDIESGWVRFEKHQIQPPMSVPVQRTVTIKRANRVLCLEDRADQGLSSLYLRNPDLFLSSITFSILDVPTISLTTTLDFAVPNPPEKRHKLIWDYLLGMEPQEIVHEANDRVRLALYRHDSPENATPVDVFTTIWIRTGSDYVPVRFESKVRAGQSKQWCLSVMTETTWTRRNDIPVPESVRMEGHFGGGTSKRTYVFNWHKVNEPLDSKLFSRDGLDLRPGTIVFDQTGPKPLLLERIGEPEPRKLGDQLLREQRHRSIGRSIFIVVNLLLACLASAAWWFSRRAKRPSRK